MQNQKNLRLKIYQKYFLVNGKNIICRHIKCLIILKEKKKLKRNKSEYNKTERGYTIHDFASYLEMGHKW